MLNNGSLKGFEAGEVGFAIANAVACVMNDHRCGVEEAVNWVCRHIERLEEEFEKAADEVERAFDGEDGTVTRKFVELSREFVVGNLEWSKVCGRYNDEELWS